MNSFEQVTNSYIEMINDELNGYIVKTGEKYDVVKEAMQYSLYAGGKRIRPILVLEFCKINGGDIKKALPFACAIEMVHCYSLIHDDLPCMDDDDFRRGKPSCHKQFGEANALLAGDALLTLAFEVIASRVKSHSLSPQACLEAVKVLSTCAGTDGMIAGQVLDLMFEGKQIDESTLYKMHDKKTGALMKAACKLGAIAAGANDEIVKQSEEFGLHLGLAFQIVDDVLDVIGDEKQLGKPIGSDAQSEKFTFVTLNGLQSAKDIGKQCTQKAHDILSNFNQNNYLSELTDWLLIRTK